MGHVGQRTGAGGGADHADRRDRGGGGAVQGLVLRSLRHCCRRLRLPVGIPTQQEAEGLHHGALWPEVHDSSAEGVWTAHPELLHPCHPARSAGRPCWLPALHHPGHRLFGHCQWHLPAGSGAWGGMATH